MRGYLQIVPVVLAVVAFAALGMPARAQVTGLADVVASCGTPNSTYVPGTSRPITQDTTGVLCDQGGGGGGGSPGGATYSIQDNAGGGNFGGIAIGTAGRLLIDQGAAQAAAWAAMSGDATIDHTGAITVTKTNGTAFSALATTTPGTGVATALGVNVGTAGAFVVLGGALGTPSSGTLTNATGLPAASVVAGALANGMTATTQSAADNSTKVATTAYADRAALDTVATGVTAAGTNQGTATALTNVQNIIATAASGTGVVMQAGVAGGHEYICNYGANTINIYPASGAQINALGTNAAIGEPTGTCAIFISVTTTQWYSVP